VIGTLLLAMHLPHALVAFDRTLFHMLNSGLGHPALDAIMPYVTDLGLGHVQVAVLLLAALVAGWKTAKRPASVWQRCRGALRSSGGWLIPAIVGILLTGTAVQVLKRAHRQRPSWFYLHERRAGRATDVKVHTIPGRRPLRVNGFPSGHTATTVSLLVTLGATLPSRRARKSTVASLAILSLLIGFSRIYMADHWPLDVLGGMGVGAACGWLAVRLGSCCRPKPHTAAADCEVAS